VTESALQIPLAMVKPLLLRALAVDENLSPSEQIAAATGSHVRSGRRGGDWPWRGTGGQFAWAAPRPSS
jgi:hypothetical protein